jgi:hypothetical protein
MNSNNKHKKNSNSSFENKYYYKYNSKYSESDSSIESSKKNITSSKYLKKGNKGDKGDKGDRGDKGDKGDKGNKSINKIILLFSSNNQVSTNSFFGTGTSSNNFLQNSVLIQYNCVATRLGFSLRKLRINQSYKATLYINGKASKLSTIIKNGSLTIGSISICNVQINALDLLSIYIESSTNFVLDDGVCASLGITIN